MDMYILGIGIQEGIELWAALSLFLLLFYGLNKFALFREALGSRNLSKTESAIFIVLFSLVGIGGAYFHVPMTGGIINFRSIGPIIGGMLGGPLVGTVVGIVVGVYRTLFFTTYADGLHGCISLLQGIVAGYISYWIKSHQYVWFTSFISGLVLEFLGSTIFIGYALLQGARDNTMDIIGPNVLVQSIAITLCMGILADSLEITRKTQYMTAKSLWKSSNWLLSALHKGFNEHSIVEIMKLILSTLPDLDKVVVRQGDMQYTLEQKGSITVEKKKIIPKDEMTYEVNVKGLIPAVQLISSKKWNRTFSPFEREFLEEWGRMIYTIYEFERLKESEKRLSLAEIRMLQAQINPHFLFNTLNTISYYCTFDSETTLNLIGYLSDYYRYSLQSPTSFVTVQEEIQSICSFLELQKARFEDRIEIEFRMPEKIDLKIPPLILQPLVENAVSHGVLRKKEGGTIIVGIKDREKDYKIYVYDNGVGISKDKKKEVLKDKGERKSIGLLNVNERLKIMYGEKSKIHLYSQEGKRTLVTFTIRKEYAHGT